jgi:micrococcal nuclease
MSASHASNPKFLSLLLGVIIIAIFTEFFDVGKFKNIDITGKDKINYTDTGYTVTHVVDGDTIDIQKGDQSYRVRLLGINTPETVDPRREVECYGKEASEYTKDEIDGAAVSIETDPSQDMYDKYGRLLAYVYNENAEMLNRKLLANGYAYEYTYNVPYKYQKEFKSLEEFARNQKRGLWASSACNK